MSDDINLRLFRRMNSAMNALTSTPDATTSPLWNFFSSEVAVEKICVAPPIDFGRRAKNKLGSASFDSTLHYHQLRFPSKYREHVERQPFAESWRACARSFWDTSPYYSNGTFILFVPPIQRIVVQSVSRLPQGRRCRQCSKPSSDDCH